MSGRALVAGFGNELRRDDGFGIRVIEELRRRGLVGEEVVLFEVGTGGLQLAQELMRGYGRLVVVDAMRRGGAPGALYVLEVEEVEDPGEVDLHLATPAKALSVARALGSLPPRVWMVGCEAREVDDLEIGLTPEVEAAVGPAADAVEGILGLRGGGAVERAASMPEGSAGPPGAGPEPDVADASVREAGLEIRRLDEVMELLYWLYGEGLEADATLGGLARFLTYPEGEVRRLVDRLVERGDVELDRDGAPSRYRLTPLGRREAARRFREDFASLLSQGHGECNDPECDCMTEGPEACTHHRPGETRTHA